MLVYLTFQISDCFRRFGIGEKDSSILVVAISEQGKSEDDLKEVRALIQGDEVSIDKLSDLTDVAEVKKMYKVKDLELNVGTLTEAVVARMVTKDFVSFS